MFLIFELRTSTTTSTSSTKYKQQDQVEAGGGAGNFLEIAYLTPLPPNINIVHRAHSHTWKKFNVINFIVKLFNVIIKIYWRKREGGGAKNE